MSSFVKTLRRWYCTARGLMNRLRADLRYLDKQLLHSQLHQFDASHYFWEESRDEFASLLSAWVRGGYADV
jgi:hypothetical protein